MRLALGTAQFGMPYGINNVVGQVSEEKAKSILKYAASVGISTIDTAIAYGESEKTLGNAGVTSFNIITKIPEIPEKTGDVECWVKTAVSESLARLHVDSLDGVMLHRPGQLFGIYGEKIIRSLRNLKSDGIIKKLGVSVYSPDEFQSLFSLYDFDIIQCPFNLVDRRLVTSGWLEELKKKGVEIHTRSSFLQGLLLMRREEMPVKFHEWNPLWEVWLDWLQKNEASATEACISYNLSFPEIDQVIVGVDTKSQLEQIITGINGATITSFPDIGSNDIELINPANWSNH